MVQSNAQTQLTCPNCRQPFVATLEQVVDATRNPSAKARLLAGRLNVVTCPHCGYQSRLSTPLVYHDQSKELLLIHVPMELGLPQPEQEKIVGSMTNAIANSLPMDQRKGYLLMPKMALTMQGLLEMVLEADGITKEVIEARRAKVRLLETFVQTDPAQLPELVKQHDSQIDREFFDIITASAENALASGRQDVTEQLLALRDGLLQLSTVGKELLESAQKQEATIQEVADALNAFGDKASYDQIIDLTLKLAQDGDEKLQVLVGLARPILNYEFFDTLTKRANKATGGERDQIVSVRERLLSFINVLDQQAAALGQRAAQTLGEIINSEDIDAAIQARLDQIDDMFLEVLAANIADAEQKKDAALAARLQEVEDRLEAVAQASTPPVVQFINELLQVKELAAAKTLLTQRAQEFGPQLVELMDVLGQNLAGRGNAPLLERLTELRAEAAQIFGQSSAASPATSAQVPAGNIRNFERRPSSDSASTKPEPKPSPDSQTTPSGIVLPFSSKRKR